MRRSGSMSKEVLQALILVIAMPVQMYKFQAEMLKVAQGDPEALAALGAGGISPTLEPIAFFTLVFAWNCITCGPKEVMSGSDSANRWC